MNNFKSFVRARSQADIQHKATAPRTSGRGAVVLMGNGNSALLRRLAHVAVQIAGAGLTSVLSPDAAAAATQSCVVVIDHADPAGAPPDIGKIIPADKIGTTIYVRGQTREPAWVALSSHEFEVLPGTEEQIAEDFTRLMKVLRCPPGRCLGPGTYYVSLTFDDMSVAMSAGESWTPPEWAVTDRGDSLHNGLEVRADLLRSQDEGFVLSQLALVRRRSEGLPIIYTVRTKSQGGAFPDDEQYFWQLMVTGLRFGVEYVDVEAGMSREGRHAFLSMAKRMHPGLLTIGSFHDIQRPLSAVPDSQLNALFGECAYGPAGGIDIVKVVCLAESAQCSIRVNQAAQQIRSSLPPTVQGIIAICTSEAGRLSRALNIMMGPTPVAHPALPGKAAPGQLSAVEIEQIRQTLGLDPNPFWNFSDAENTEGNGNGPDASSSPNPKRRKYADPS